MKELLNMLFFQPLYNLLVNLYATRINHFALIKLFLVALDKTLFYFLLFAVLRLFWLLLIRRRRRPKSEAIIWLLAFYLILVLMLTTFRDSYFPWQIIWHWHRPLSAINFVFMKETWKLFYAPSRLDFFYNSLGNVLCFMPLGLLLPLAYPGKFNFLATVIGGLLFSVIIESLQFFLATGVSDIDDVFFNTVGGTIGYGLYRFFHRQKASL